MRLMTYRDPDGVTFGIEQDGSIFELGRTLGIGSLRAALSSGATLTPKTRSDCRLDEVVVLPPVPDAQKIVCVGLNYKAHAAEAQREMPAQPSIFLRTSSSLVGHGQPLVRPRVSDNFDFEGELAVVIGKRARHIPASQALQMIAGYTCFNDGSVRDHQKHSVTAGKNFEKSGACGPWMVTSDEIPDPALLTLLTRLNGDVVQQSSTDLLIYPLPVIIEYVSRIFQLEPGDIIATGTPAGVGARRVPPLWMKPGDRIEVEISGIGALINPIEPEA